MSSSNKNRFKRGKLYHVTFNINGVKYLDAILKYKCKRDFDFGQYGIDTHYYFKIIEERMSHDYSILRAFTYNVKNKRNKDTFFITGSSLNNNEIDLKIEPIVKLLIEKEIEDFIK